MHIQNRTTTTVLLATTLLLGTAACGSDASPGAASADAAPSAAAPASPPPAPQAPVTPGPGAEPGPTADAPAEPAFDGTTVEVIFTGGEVQTAEPRVVVPLGARVRLITTSDVVDEIHIHGVDEYVDLTPGTPVTHDFAASIPGIFEVELHDAGDLLFTLQVEP